MDILYNTEQKEVAIILGYGIGIYLSLAFLEEIVNDIKELFPQLTLQQMRELKFMECAESSRSHKNEWYTRFPYDLSGYEKNEWGNIVLQGDHKLVYAIKSHKKGEDGWPHEDESAESIMNSLIHD